MNDYQLLVNALIGVIDLKQSQEEFFRMLADFQEKSVYYALDEYNKFNGKMSLEDVLFSAIYDVLYNLMENIDGYDDYHQKFNIVNKDTKQSIKGNTELHDTIANYLKY